MKKYNIAFTGVFDIENYGDHLFPLVFREKMKKKGIDCELFLFSPIGDVQQGYQQNYEVYPLYKLQELHDRYHFDAVIVGGGGILHYASGKQLLDKNSTEFVDYKVFETWVIPSLFAYNNKVKLIWNLPGGFHEFDYFYKPLTRCLCTTVDYMSVRDQYTKDILTSCNIPADKIYTCLDSAFIMKTLFKKEDLMSIKNKIIQSDSYVIYHANIHLPENEIPELVENLYKLKCEGHDIVLLPIAYTHNDQAILNKINEYSINTYGEDGAFTVLGENLNMMDIMSLLACCKLYIGVSFHGAVTALSFSNSAIGYDYMHNGKTKDLFKTLNIPQYYITNSNELEKTIQSIKTEGCHVELNQKIVNINHHFDNMCHILEEDYKEKDRHQFYLEFSQAIFEINNFYEKCKNYDDITDQLSHLDQLARATHIQLENLKYEHQQLQDKYLETVNQLEQTTAQLQKIQNTVLYKGYRKVKRVFKNK